jgi:LmbE family N-acetylglucosaminyl deacetylase
MVVVAHPDDEVLGLGGTMNHLISECNCNVRVVILGEGITSRDEKRDVQSQTRALKIHRENIEKARQVIGYHAVAIYDFPDNRFDDVNLLDIVKVIEKEKNDFQPDFIFTHHGEDLNIDHRLTFEAVLTASRPMKDERLSGILTFETPSATEWRAYNPSLVFCPNYFYSIGEKNLDAKIQGMESYEYERRTSPHPRSPEALRILAKRYGSIVGCDYAEPFNIIRMVERIEDA